MLTEELQQFCLVARSQKDRACANIIQQVLKDKNIHVFGELLAVPSVQALRGTEYNTAFETLELFAYGTLNDYLESPSSYLELTEIMVQKLRRLTLLSLAARQQRLHYSLLLQALHLQTVRELEDFLIETIYGGLISGKINQRDQIFHVLKTTPRDVRPADLVNIVDSLTRFKLRAAIAREELQWGRNELENQRRKHDIEDRNAQQKMDHQKEQLKMMIDSGEMDAYDLAFGGASTTFSGGRVRSQGRFGSGGAATKASSASTDRYTSFLNTAGSSNSGATRSLFGSGNAGSIARGNF